MTQYYLSDFDEETRQSIERQLISMISSSSSTIISGLSTHVGLDCVHFKLNGTFYMQAKWNPDTGKVIRRSIREVWCGSRH